MATEKKTRVKKNRINGDIEAPEVRLIGADGEQVGVVALAEALRVAAESELDLVEIVPTAEPPVCRVMDFGKFLFDMNKKRHAAKKKQKQVQIKEMKFRPATDEGDFLIKVRNLRRFLGSGDKIKVTLRFRGREMVHQEIGMQMLQRVENDLQDIGTVDQYPKLEGRQLVMVMSPKRGTTGHAAASRAAEDDEDDED